MPLRRILLVGNAGAGSASEEGDPLRRRIEAAFAAAGAELTARWVAGGALAAAARGALAGGYDAVVAVGGDGTINTVARALGGAGPPLGIVPAGTLNHFAKDLGLPLDPEAAARVVVGGHARRVDVGEVNGRLFLNNSSIGAYPAAVAERERLRARGRGKWSAMAAAVLRTRRRFVPRRLRLDLAGVRLVRSTPAVLIANNAYRLGGPGFGRRERLDAGRLWCYVAAHDGFPRLVRMTLRALCNQLEAAPELVALPVATLAVHAQARHLPVAIDGEVVRLATPLRYRIRPGMLAVIVPGAE